MEKVGNNYTEDYCPTCCEVVASIDIKTLQSKIKEAKNILNRGLEFIICEKCNEKQKRGAGNYCAKCGYKLPETKNLKKKFSKGNR